MDYFNSVINQLLTKNEIKTLIDSCFLKKFQEFENNLNIICKIYPETITHLFYNSRQKSELLHHRS